MATICYCDFSHSLHSPLSTSWKKFIFYGLSRWAWCTRVSKCVLLTSRNRKGDAKNRRSLTLRAADLTRSSDTPRAASSYICTLTCTIPSSSVVVLRQNRRLLLECAFVCTTYRALTRFPPLRSPFARSEWATSNTYRKVSGETCE